MSVGIGFFGRGPLVGVEFFGRPVVGGRLIVGHFFGADFLGDGVTGDFFLDSRYVVHAGEAHAAGALRVGDVQLTLPG